MAAMLRIVIVIAGRTHPRSKLLAMLTVKKVLHGFLFHAWM